MGTEQFEPSAYTGGEIKVVIRYASIDLLEVEDVSYEVDRKGRPGGAGIGHPQNRYHKFGVPSGTFSISKAYLNAGDQADLFAQLVAGTTQVQTEGFASGAASKVLTYQPTYIMAVTVTGGDAWEILVEGTDYTVNYATKTVTFVGGASGAGKIVYTSNATALLADDPMNGAYTPLMFDVEWKRRSDSVVVKRLLGCAPYTQGAASGGKGEEAFTEDLAGEFLALQTSPSS